MVLTMLNRRIGDKNGPAARNLRKRGICFRREPANICTPRNDFFLRVIPFLERTGAKS